MPSAISSPREPVEIDSISIGLPPLPSRMIEPLPNARSIWDSAASSALVLSIPPPSTTRSVLWAIFPPYDWNSQTGNTLVAIIHPAASKLDQCTRFVLGSQDVLAGREGDGPGPAPGVRVLAGFGGRTCDPPRADRIGGDDFGAIEREERHKKKPCRACN